MEVLGHSRFNFGPFILDPEEKVLLRGAHPISLPPKALETLLVLVQRHGHVLEKTELLNKVWRDTFVEEATLAQNIFTLRKVLGDSVEDHQYIETVPKRGYRFVAPIRELAADTQQDTATTQTTSIALRSRERWVARVGAAVAILALGAAAYLTWKRLWPSLRGRAWAARSTDLRP